MLRRLVIVLALLLAPIPAIAQTVILGEYRPGQAVSASSLPVVLPSDQTVAISAASLPLPSGAATEVTLANVLTSANFAAAFGTAGTADSQVLSIQGIAAMTPLQVQSNSANLATEATLGNVLTSANFAAAFGTAGTADAQVLTVQGIASMTPILATVTATNLDVQIGGSDTVTVTATNLDVQSGGADLVTSSNFTTVFGTVDLVKAEDDPSANLDPGFVFLARRTATPANTSGADLDYEAVQMAAGRLWTSTVLTDGTDTALVDGSGNLQITGSISCSNCSGSGASDVEGSTYTLGTDSVAPLGAYFDDTSPTAATEDRIHLVRMTSARALHVAQQGSVTVTDGAGALNVIIDSGTTAVTNAGTFAVQVDGSALTALQLIDDAQTGDSVHYRTSAGATEDEHEIKATAGRLFSVAFTNTNAAARYVRCYNLTAANTTPGTSTVFWGLAIPGATTGSGLMHSFGPNGMAFSTALTCTFTTGAADSDVAEVAANEIKATYTFK